MPRFEVEWVWRVVWVVEAESKQALRHAARELSHEVFEQACSPHDVEDVSVSHEMPSTLAEPPDAVFVDNDAAEYDGFLFPDDAAAVAEWERLVAAAESKEE